MNPKYPIYIPSKSRWESRLTVKSLERIGVPYKVVIEPHELDQYAAVIDRANILLLPWSKPESHTELVPARNWIKDHATAAGAKRHWQLDDNISGFFRLNYNLKTPVADGTIFRAAEDFCDRYDNVAQAGFNYFMFAPRKAKIPPLYLNTRIYSCTLTLNSIPHRWRGVYNDDTDISLRILKEGYCTVLFNAFLCKKSLTMSVKGGNTPIYQEDGRKRMAESLRAQHPDVTTVIWKWGRWQHQVDYRPFKKNKLWLRDGLVIPPGVNNYGMVLRRRRPGSPLIDLTEVAAETEAEDSGGSCGES